jgi:hypothetical protein
VRHYHALSTDVLTATPDDLDAALKLAGDARGAVGEVVVRLAARLRVLAANCSIIEA